MPIGRIMYIIVIAALMPLQARAGETFDRIGVSIGGMNIVGLYYEHGTDDVAVRAQIGAMIHAVSLNVAAVHYFDAGNEHRPYAGIGYMKHFNEMSLSGDNLLSIPAGYDFHFSGDQFLAVELLPAVSISAMRPHHNGKRLYDYIFPLPCVYYKYKL